MDNANFIGAVDATLKNEGGLLRDEDGLTRLGITSEFIAQAKCDHPDDGDIQCMAVANISESQAIKLYKLQVWDKLGLDAMSSTPWLQAKVFDSAVNIGNYRAVIFLQSAITNAGGPKLRCDGVIGVKTLAGVKMIPEKDIMRWYKVELIANYYNIIKLYPEKVRYIRGWLWRAVG